jgi:hypothetical protein
MMATAPCPPADRMAGAIITPRVCCGVASRAGHAFRPNLDTGNALSRLRAGQSATIAATATRAVAARE